MPGRVQVWGGDGATCLASGLLPSAAAATFLLQTHRTSTKSGPRPTRLRPRRAHSAKHFPSANASPANLLSHMGQKIGRGDSRIVRPRLTPTLTPYNSIRATLCYATDSPMFLLTKVVFSPTPGGDFPPRVKHFTYLSGVAV